MPIEDLPFHPALNPLILIAGRLGTRERTENERDD
jgi:hypothetical protein